MWQRLRDRQTENRSIPITFHFHSLSYTKNKRNNSEIFAWNTVWKFLHLTFKNIHGKHFDMKIVLFWGQKHMSYILYGKGGSVKLSLKRISNAIYDWKRVHWCIEYKKYAYLHRKRCFYFNLHKITPTYKIYDEYFIFHEISNTLEVRFDMR